MILFTCISGVALLAIYIAACYALGLIADTMAESKYGYLNNLCPVCGLAEE